MNTGFKILCLSAAVALVSSCGNIPVKRHILFVNPDSTSIPYRIPAIASFKDGTLLALADYRHCRADIGFGRVDIHSKTSPDNGKTWSETSTVIEGTGKRGATDCGFGDPAVVIDRETGEVLMMAVCGETVYWMESTNRKNPNRIAALRSFDKGKTWSKWEEITENIYSLFDECTEGCVESCFIGSGKIFQSRVTKIGKYYRIYAALCARPNGNRVIYSDDFGRSWKALGGADALPAKDGNEPKCEELPDGRVILSSRAEGGRIFNIYTYTDVSNGAGRWEEAAFSGKINNGCTAVENSCNGEILIVRATRKDDEKKVDLAFQSVPLGPGRANVGIWYKELPSDTASITSVSLAADWKGPYQISEEKSAYSTMVQQSDGLIGFFYEETENADRSGYNLVYMAIPIDSISCDRYTI